MFALTRNKWNMLVCVVLLWLVSWNSYAVSGTLIYRLYLPKGDWQKTPLPTLTFHYSDGRKSRKLTTCPQNSLSWIYHLYVGRGQEKNCAWAVFANPVHNPILNSALPDSSAYYWVTHFTIDPSMSIDIEGTYVDARFMSINVYDQTGSNFEKNGISSALADYQIVPLGNEVNPWQTPAGSKNRFKIKVVQNPTRLGEELPYPEPGEGGTVGDYPEPCTDVCPPMNAFFRGEDGTGLLGEVNNAYLSALIQPKAGEVLVIRGKAPTVKRNRLAQPWPMDEQVRYWSFCHYLYRNPYPLVINKINKKGVFMGQKMRMEASCAADGDIPLDLDRYYTLVVGAPGDRPDSLPKDVVWLSHSQASPDQRHILLLRNQLQNAFPQAIHNVPQDFNPLSAYGVMGDYYPRIYPCALTTFKEAGWQGCI